MVAVHRAADCVKQWFIIQVVVVQATQSNLQKRDADAGYKAYFSFFIVLFAVPGPHRDSRLRVGCTPFGIWNKYILEIARKKSAREFLFSVYFFFFTMCARFAFLQLVFTFFSLFRMYQGSYSFELFKVHDFFHDLFKFSITLGLAVTFRKFSKLSLFQGIFYLKQFNRHKLWYPPKCGPLALFNHSSLHYCILHCPSAVTDL